MHKSKTIIIRIDNDLKKKAAELAVKDGRSLASLIRRLLVLATKKGEVEI